MFVDSLSTNIYLGVWSGLAAWFLRWRVDTMNGGFIHKIAVLGKDFYSIRTIDDLFIFAGADPNWWEDPGKDYGSQRMDHVYGWVEGLNRNAPHQLEQILKGVAVQMAENTEISDTDKDFLRRHMDLPPTRSHQPTSLMTRSIVMPDDVQELLEVLIKGLARAMFPLKHRRKNLPCLAFDNEYDVQDLLHSLLRPWVKDIRAEEYTPSYAGSSTRIDFLCADYDIVLEVKYMRDATHGKKIGEELILDIAHYRAHPACKHLWIVIYDPYSFIPNPGGLVSDLDGEHISGPEIVMVRTFVLNP